nr:MAG TPA: hypothetical protein [Caudoviricetes sp.]
MSISCRNKSVQDFLFRKVMLPPCLKIKYCITFQHYYVYSIGCYLWTT